MVKERWTRAGFVMSCIGLTLVYVKERFPLKLNGLVCLFFVGEDAD